MYDFSVRSHMLAPKYYGFASRRDAETAEEKLNSKNLCKTNSRRTAKSSSTTIPMQISPQRTPRSTEENPVFKSSLGYSVSSVVILFTEIEEKFAWMLTLQFS